MSAAAWRRQKGAENGPETPPGPVSSTDKRLMGLRLDDEGMNFVSLISVFCYRSREIRPRVPGVPQQARSAWGGADPGPMRRHCTVGPGAAARCCVWAPDRRRTVPLRCTLRRIQGTRRRYCDTLRRIRSRRRRGGPEFVAAEAAQPPHAAARLSKNAFSRALRLSAAARSNSSRASASRPARNRKSPLAAGNGA
jgi:hypothetical protein